MGVIYKCTCKSCNFEQEFFLGAGISFFGLDKNLSAILPEEKLALAVLIDNDNIKDVDIANRITKCAKCNQISSKKIIKICDKNLKTIFFGNKCDKCKDELIIFDDICVKENKCPQCLKNNAEYKEVGHWD